MSHGKTFIDIQKAAVLNKNLLGNIHKEVKRKIMSGRELWSETQEKGRKEKSVKKTNDAERLQGGKVASKTRETVVKGAT